MAGGALFAARKPLPSGELRLACPHQGRRGQTKDGGLSCVGVLVWGEGSVGFHRWLFLAGRLTPVRKAMGKSGPRKVRVGMILSRWLCGEDGNQLCGLSWFQEGQLEVCRELAGDAGKWRRWPGPCIGPARTSGCLTPGGLAELAGWESFQGNWRHARSPPSSPCPAF